MAERIEEIVYEPKVAGKPDKSQPFFNGPAEFLAYQITEELKKDAGWTKIFGEFIDPYLRMDYAIRNLPVLRIYNQVQRKEFESWFIEGDIKADIILPASLRRNDTQQVQDTLSAALLQQFRRPSFFNNLCNLVPGLNELGKRFEVDKSLGFEFEEAEVPLTQVTLNFRLDLRVWDDYLEATYRTKDSPYNPVLADLDQLYTIIEGLKDDLEAVEVEIAADINTGD